MFTSLDPPSVPHEFGEHRGIDGMTIDADGYIVATCGWTRSGPGPRIAVFAPDGTLMAEHPVPADPTNCTFGEPGLSVLYVTTADGCLYRAQTDRHGQASPHLTTRASQHLLPEKVQLGEESQIDKGNAWELNL